MSDIRRQERLRWYVRRFLEAEGADAARLRSGASGSSVLVEDPEEGRTAVHVTELLRPPAGGDRESVREFRRSLAREAARRWSERAGDVRVEVWLEFSGHEQTTSARDRSGLADALCELVAANLPEADGFARIVPEDPVGRADFPFALSGVTVARLGDYTGSSWRVAAAAPSKAVDGDGVRAAVRRASERTDAGEEAGGRWLLLVADSFRLTGRPAIADEVTGDTYPGTFDRVVLFDPVTGETTSLRTGEEDAP